MQPLNEYLNDHLFIQCIEHVASDYRFDDVTASEPTVSKAHDGTHQTLRVTFIGTGTFVETILTPQATVNLWLKRFGEALDFNRPNKPRAIQYVIEDTIAHYVAMDAMAKPTDDTVPVPVDLVTHPSYEPDRHVIRTIPVHCQNMYGVIHAARHPDQAHDEITAIVDVITSAQIDTMIKRLYTNTRKP